MIISTTVYTCEISGVVKALAQQTRDRGVFDITQKLFQ